MAKNNNRGDRKQTICERHNCCWCCDPVKIHRFSEAGEKIPFWRERQGILLVPEKHPESTKLKIYDCDRLDKDTGLCTDYENRPKVCRNTMCPAMETDNEEEQAKIIEEIKREKFIQIGFNKIK